MEAALTGDALVYAQILADMRDGVLTLDLAGQIITFNAAAGQLLGMEPAAVIGRSYAELFVADAAYEPLSDLVIEAIYDPTTTHSREIELCLPQGCPTLLVRTTLLRGPAGPRGVIVVLSDLSEQRKRRKLKRLFGTYVDPRIVARLLEQADRIGAGTWETATIEFVDLVGFTRLCELLAPADLVRFLNAYLEEMAGPIDAHDGVTDKYMGDGIMAFWDAGLRPWRRPGRARLPGGPRPAPCPGAAPHPHARRSWPAGRGSLGRDPLRHRHRRGAGRQHRLGPLAQLHRHRRRGERRGPNSRPPTRSWARTSWWPRPPASVPATRSASVPMAGSSCRGAAGPKPSSSSKASADLPGRLFAFL